MAVKDLVSGVLAESITTSTTNILVTIAQSIGAQGIQAFFPTPPFYITIMPKSPIVGVANRLDSEIIQVTAVGHDQVGNAALTGVRAQRDTTAKPFSAGDIVTVGVYTDDAVLLGGTGTTETAQPWITANDIIGGAVASTLASGAVVETVGSGSNICWKFANGFMIAMVKKTQTVTFDTWGSVAESETIVPPNFAVAFYSTPFCVASINDTGLQAWLGVGSGRNNTSGYSLSATRGQGVVAHRTNTGSSSITVSWLAIGRWKA